MSSSSPNREGSPVEEGEGNGARPVTTEENTLRRPSSRQLNRHPNGIMSERDLRRSVLTSPGDSLARQNTNGQAIPPLLKILSGQNTPRVASGSPNLSGQTSPRSFRRLTSISTNARNVFEPDEIEFFNEMIRMRPSSSSGRFTSTEMNGFDTTTTTNTSGHRLSSTMVQVMEDDHSSQASAHSDEYETTKDHYQQDDDDALSEKLCIPEYRTLPRYLMPTVSSTLPPYLNGEIERVRNSYNKGNYFHLKKLPSRLEPGNIQLTRKQHTTENLITSHDHVFKPASKLRHNSFHPLVYVGTDYDKQKNLNKYIMDQEKVVTESYSRKPFKFNHKKRLKFEDTFYDPDYKVPDMGPGQDILELKTITRSEVTQSNKYIFGKFTISKGKVNHGDSELVKKWMRQLHDQLARDWPEYAFRVKFTVSNEFLVQFLKPSDEEDEDIQQQQQQPYHEGGFVEGEVEGMEQKYHHRRHQDNSQFEFDERLEEKGSTSTLPQGQNLYHGEERQSATSGMLMNSGRESGRESQESWKQQSSQPQQSQKPKKLRPIFPPPNNLLSKYMQRLATTGLAKEFKWMKRGDRWNIMEEEYVTMNDSLTSGTGWEDVEEESTLPSDSQGQTQYGGDRPASSSGKMTANLSQLDITNQMQMMINLNEAIPLALSPKISSPVAAAQAVERFSLIRPDGSPISRSRSNDSHNQQYGSGGGGGVYDEMGIAPSYSHSSRNSPSQGKGRKAMNWYVPSAEEHRSNTNHAQNITASGSRVCSVEEAGMIGIRKAALRSPPNEPLTQHHHELHQHMVLNPGHGYNHNSNSQAHSQSHSQPSMSPVAVDSARSGGAGAGGGGVGGSIQMQNKHAAMLDESALHQQPGTCNNDLISPATQSPSSKHTKSAFQQKVLHYLTFSFYAPWICSSQLNTAKMIAHKNRLEAKKVMEEKKKQKKVYKLMKFDPKNPEKFTAFLHENEPAHPMAGFVSHSHDGHEEAMDRIAEVGRQFTNAMSTKHVTIGGVNGASNGGSSSTSVASSISTSGAHSANMVAASDAAMIAKRRMLVG